MRTWLVSQGSAGFGVSEVNPSLSFPAVRAQTYLVFALILLLLVGVYKWHASLSSLEKVASIYTTVVFLFMLIQSVSSSTYRTEALLLPAVLLVKRLPIAIQVVLCGAAAYIAYQMGVLWFANQLA